MLFFFQATDEETLKKLESAASYLKSFPEKETLEAASVGDIQQVLIINVFRIIALPNVSPSFSHLIEYPVISDHSKDCSQDKEGVLYRSYRWPTTA